MKTFLQFMSEGAYPFDSSKDKPKKKKAPGQLGPVAFGSNVSYGYGGPGD